MALSKQQEAALTAQVKSHPKFNELVAKAPRARGSYLISGDALRAAGINVPQGYHYDLHGGRIFKDWGAADTVMSILGGSVLGAAAPLALSGPASAASTAPAGSSLMSGANTIGTAGVLGDIATGTSASAGLSSSLGGKLLDTLTSPEIVKAGIGAGLSALDDRGEKRRFEGNIAAPELLEKLMRAISTGGVARINMLNRPLNSVAPINFNADIPGLPFKIGLNTPEIKPKSRVSELDDLKRLLAGL